MHRFDSGFRRRDFLHAGALSAFGFGLNDLFATKALGAVDPRKDVNCIMLFLVGGPSHLDTWDMKPDAPAEIRGPYRPIKTNVAGIEISEIFPRMARHADKYALIRSVHHTGGASHDAGHQLMQTGRLFLDGVEHPHIGCVVAKLKGPKNGAPAHVLLPRPVGDTGGNMPHGQSAGFLGRAYDPATPPELARESDEVRRKYGQNRFGQSCLLARRLVESGVRFVTVNMFDTVFGEPTWDIHGWKPFSPISCYRDAVGPMFDMAFSSLIEDLHDRGLLNNTLVLAMGEFGRTPKINAAGGRDHWPECWTIVMAGGGIQGGQVIGASDRIGAAPKERPVSPAEVAATIYQALGISPDLELRDAHGRAIPLVERGAKPIQALFV